jgi:hypothetical protein
MRILSLCLVGLTSVGGCSTLLNGKARDFRSPAVVHVENNGYADVQIYAESGFKGNTAQDPAQYVAHRVHLGRAPVGTRSDFIIPWELVYGITPVRFVAFEVNRKSAVLDQEFTVLAPDTVLLSIPAAAPEH